MKIATPVKYNADLECVFDDDGKCLIGTGGHKCSNEVVKRINLHDELVKSLREMVEVVGSNFCGNQETKRKYKEAFKLLNELEKCK